MKKYEATIILTKQIDDGEIEKKLEPVRKAVEKFGGTVAAATRMGRYTFARPFKSGKHDEGVYILLSFSMPPEQIEAFREEFKYNEDIIRMQIVVAKETKQAKPEKEEAPAAE